MEGLVLCEMIGGMGLSTIQVVGELIRNAGKEAPKYDLTGRQLRGR